MESVLDAVSNDCVSSVGAAIEASAYIVVLGKDVDKFALALVSPLGAQNDAEAGL